MTSSFSAGTFGAVITLIRETLAGAGALRGEPGKNGREVTIHNDGTHIRWQYVGSSAWNNIVALSELKGRDGESPELQVTNNVLQYKFPSQNRWTDIFRFPEYVTVTILRETIAAAFEEHNNDEDAHGLREIREDIESLKSEGGNESGGGDVSLNWDSITGKPETFPPDEHTHTLSEITDYSVLPIITHIQYAGDKMTMGALSQSRQALRNKLSFANEQCSIRPIKLYFDKLTKENQYIQPFVYNRLGETIKESSRGSNQEIFRGGHDNKREHKKEKGWGQVNITQNIQRADGSGATVAKAPLFTDSAGNQFFAHGIIKLAPGIASIAIPAEYQAGQLIFHTKSHSARSIRGPYLAANYIAESSQITFTAINQERYSYTALNDGFICVGVEGSAIFTITVDDKPVNQNIAFSADYAKIANPIPVVAGNIIEVSKMPYTSSIQQISGVYGYFIPLKRRNSPGNAPLPTHFRSHRALADIRATNNGWIAHKAWMKLAVSEYVPPQGTIGTPQYVNGKYRKGALSAITLTSDRYAIQTDINGNGGIVWSTSLIER